MNKTTDKEISRLLTIIKREIPPEGYKLGAVCYEGKYKLYQGIVNGLLGKVKPEHRWKKASTGETFYNQQIVLDMIEEGINNHTYSYSKGTKLKHVWFSHKAQPRASKFKQKMSHQLNIESLLNSYIKMGVGSKSLRYAKLYTSVYIELGVRKKEFDMRWKLSAIPTKKDYLIQNHPKEFKKVLVRLLGFNK